MQQLTHKKVWFSYKRERFDILNNWYNPAMIEQTLTANRKPPTANRQMRIAESKMRTAENGKKGLFTSGTGLQLYRKSCQNKNNSSEQQVVWVFPIYTIYSLLT